MQVVPGLVIEDWGGLDLDRAERRQHPSSCSPPVSQSMPQHQHLCQHQNQHHRHQDCQHQHQHRCQNHAHDHGLVNISIKISVKAPFCCSDTRVLASIWYPNEYPVTKPSRDHISSLDFLGWLKASQQIAKSEQQKQFEKERDIDPFKQLAKKLSSRKICHKYLVHV